MPAMVKLLPIVHFPPQCDVVVFIAQFVAAGTLDRGGSAHRHTGLSYPASSHRLSRGRLASLLFDADGRVFSSSDGEP